MSRPTGIDADLLDLVLAAVGRERFARCRGAGGLLLNEVCSVGTECDEDVRIADFVEVYNPGATPADLACHAVAHSRDFLTGELDSPMIAAGTLDGRGLRAFGETDLGFRIKKADDWIRLYRLGEDAEGAPILVETDQVTLAVDAAHWYRRPDGGGWMHLSVSDAETESAATFGRSNVESAQPP